MQTTRTPGTGREARALAVAFGLAALSLAGTVSAQTYPTKSLRLVVPFPPGGGTDTLARQFALQLAESLGQPITVDNRAGAGGNLGAEIVAKAPADGYTIMLSSNSLVINASLYQKLNYNALTDLAPLALVASAPLVLAVHPLVPVKGVKDLVAVAKKTRGGLNFGSNGNGTSSHLSGELFRISAGIDLTHIPYKGGPPVIAALLGGELDMGFTTLISAMPHVRAGKLRILAVTTPKSSSALPEAPPMSAFFPGYAIDIWYGIFAPAGTPAAIQERLTAEIRKAHGSATVRTAMERDGAEAAWMAPAEFVPFFKREIEKYGKLVKLAGAKAE
ncbi:MAG: tripartite tricarboxylate transporter substrate binding protein [Proteobacteria bacterium]|nr:tripartite tricarboxylate transporter substrate binding protein [Burkholderiales bacterium]